MSECRTVMPHLASTACTWSLHDVRNPTTLCRCRVTSRSARTAAARTRASGSRPSRSRSARSAQSRSSFFTRR